MEQEKKGRKPRKGQDRKQDIPKEASEWKEKVIQIRRVTKVVKDRKSVV